MVTTFEYAPAPALAPYIRCYVYREFSTTGCNNIKPWFASHELSIHFFFKDLPIKLSNPVTGEILNTAKPSDILGMSSQYNGDMHFNGDYSFFQIICKPDGFYKLSRIPASHMINRIVSSDEIFDNEIKLLHQKLYDAESSIQMAALADTFLLSYLKKQKSINSKNGISSAVHLIVKNAGFVSVDALARNSNMSLRNFERLFDVAIGMSPKLLCSVTRFNQALALKLQNSKMHWTSIAHRVGYFDQMHLIKDFKKFSGDTPKDLVRDTFLLEEDYTIS